MSVSASKWKLPDLNALGIFYEEKPDELTFFSKIIEVRVKDNPNLTKVSNLGDTFVLLTKKHWTSSIDLNNDHSQEMENIFSLSATAKDIDNDLHNLKSTYDQSISPFLPTDLALREKALERFASAFHRWMINVKEFLYSYNMVISRWDDTREEIYTQLFAAFARISFLNSESGHMYKRGMTINNNYVNGMPDLRFETYMKSEDVVPDKKEKPKLLVVSEVKQYDSLKKRMDSTPFSCGDIDPDALAQHGIELLLEMEGSLFTPNVFGCLCIGTQVIVTYLEITEDQKETIKRGTLDDNGARIHYSRPYNYMNELDRKEILKLFFWFGYMQSEFLDNIFKEPVIK